MNNNYFDSEEFQEMLRNYEEAINNGESPLLDSDDFTSSAEYYNTKGETEKACHNRAVKEGIKQKEGTGTPDASDQRVPLFFVFSLPQALSPYLSIHSFTAFRSFPKDWIATTRF